MASRAPAKAARFIFLLDETERDRLEELANGEGRTAAGWLRSAINRAYVAKFGDKPSKKNKGGK